MKKIKDNIYIFILAISVILICVILIYGLTRKEEEKAIPTVSVSQDVYYIDEHLLADFSEPIIEKFNEESELIVYTADVSISVNLEQIGIVNWDIFNKTQSLTYKGTGKFYVDLSSLSEKNITLDNNKCVVTIEVPHAKLAPIEIDPDKFKAEEVDKGLLAFGDLKFTPSEFNKIEKEAKNRIYNSVNTNKNFEQADERVKEELKKIYEPLVKLSDESYDVEIVFIR